MKNKSLNKKLVEKIMVAKHCSKHDAEAWLKSVILNNAELSRVSGGVDVLTPSQQIVQDAIDRIYGGKVGSPPISPGMDTADTTKGFAPKAPKAWGG